MAISYDRSWFLAIVTRGGTKQDVADGTVICWRDVGYLGGCGSGDVVLVGRLQQMLCSREEMDGLREDRRKWEECQVYINKSLDEESGVEFV